MSTSPSKKVVPNRLPPEVFDALKAVVGERWISQQRSVIETYSKFSIDGQSFLRKYAKDPHAIPACIILPGNTEEVQAIVKLCNRYRVPFLPFTNGQVFCNVTTPAPTLCIHLSRMNRVLAIDEDTMTATLQAYVDYAQLQAEAMKKGLWNGGSPLATSRCKLASQFSFVGLWQTDLKYGQLNRNLISVRMVLPDGEILDLGSRCLPRAGDFWEYGPGPDLLGLMRGGPVGQIQGDLDFPERPCRNLEVQAKSQPLPSHQPLKMDGNIRTVLGVRRASLDPHVLLQEALPQFGHIHGVGALGHLHSLSEAHQ